MILNICDKSFDTDYIKDISITESFVMIDAVDDFYRVRYTDKRQIEEAISWKKFQKLDAEQLRDAITTIILTCDFYINSKTQCADCPISNNKGCLLSKIPIDWREQ